MKLTVEVATTVRRSARVMQAEGIFDIPPSENSDLRWDVDMPIEDRKWNVGLIVGPSGCGKSTIAKRLWPEHTGKVMEWPADSLLEAFPRSMGIKEILELLSSVGFSSPPAWCRPFGVLSNGEQFRVTIARLLAESSALTVVDEFTSVVDRTVAQVGSSAIQKTVRRRGGQFVAVTCHEDVEAWLQPDWVYRPAEGAFTWREVQRRPDVDLEVVRATAAAWDGFARHHYLSAHLNRSAKVFLGLVRGYPAAFGALLPMPHGVLKDVYRVHRLVITPDFQGLGLGAHSFSDALGAIATTVGKRLWITTGHPGLIAAWSRPNSRWVMKKAPGFSPPPGRSSTLKSLRKTVASQRYVASFRYGGPALSTAQAEAGHALWAGV